MFKVHSPSLPEKRHLVPECLDLFRTRIFDVKGLDRYGPVPVAAVDGTERPHADVLPVKLDVLGGDFPILDGLLRHVLDLLGGGLVGRRRARARRSQRRRRRRRHRPRRLRRAASNTAAAAVGEQLIELNHALC